MKQPFESAVALHEGRLVEYTKKSNRAGTLKLVLFALFAVSVFLMLTRWDQVGYKIAAGALLAVQAPAWLYHSWLHRAMAHSAGLIAINRRHLARIDGSWTDFDDTGGEFAEPEHPYGSDLDIVGRKSLFQYLSTAHTWHGRRALAGDLLHAAYSAPQLTQRQDACGELASDLDYTTELEYIYSQIGCNEAESQLVAELATTIPFLRSRAAKVLLRYLPFLVLAFLGLVLLLGWKPLVLTALCLLLAQTLVWLGGLLRTNRYLKGLGGLPRKLDAYADVIAMIEARPFTSECLQQLKATLAGDGLSAAQAIRALSRISDMASVRSNALVWVLLNILLLWDIRCALRFSDWKSLYGPHAGGWFRALGEMESLASLSVLPNVCDHTCYPCFTEQYGVQAEEIGHPLIQNGRRVTNPLQLRDSILIISGSNMSGKTTYLRTVGINVVLARAGGPVCAGKMTLSDLHITTSMRVADDLNEGISTFYAELKRIKAILAAAESDKNILFLIDEIFRGTNSVDRLSGAAAVIQKLSGLGAIGMITTHDLELCELAREDPRVEINSFSEYYEGEQICFDYKLRPGKSKTTNAKYLMKILGIL